MQHRNSKGRRNSIHRSASDTLGERGEKCRRSALAGLRVEYWCASTGIHARMCAVALLSLVLLLTESPATAQDNEDRAGYEHFSPAEQATLRARMAKLRSEGVRIHAEIQQRRDAAQALRGTARKPGLRSGRAVR